MQKKKIEYFQLKLPFSLFLGIFSDGGVVNWISALSIILEYSSETQHKPNKMYKKTPQTYRSIRPEVFYKKAVLKNFAKLIGKHLCLSLFFNKVVGLRPATY